MIDQEVRDLPREELVPIMERYIKEGFKVWVKWTCPTCGVRCASDEANTMNLSGYVHLECGTWYKEDRFGLFAVIEMSP